jgi:hypothetical protein
LHPEVGWVKLEPRAVIVLDYERLSKRGATRLKEASIPTIFKAWMSLSIIIKLEFELKPLPQQVH